MYSDGQYSDVVVAGDRAGFAFPMEKGIGTGSISTAKPGEKPVPIPVSARPEAVSREDDFTDCTIRYWYGDRLYMSGEQDVAVGGDRKRVFFINRLKLSP